jgi:hypothetical protein
MAKRGKGMTFSASLEGGDELVRKLRAMSRDARGATLERAVDAGIAPAEQRIRADAPGSGIVSEVADKPNTPNTKARQVGPDKDHWYYQFFETGVQPFEIDLVRRKSKRSAVNRKTGRRMSGRKVAGDTQALKFEIGGATVFAKKVRRGGMAARPFMRKNFLGSTERMETAFGDEIERAVINPHLEKK